MTTQIKISALWQQTSGKGHVFFSGIPFKGARNKVVVFPNVQKENGKQPDFRVYVESVEQGDDYQPWQHQLGALWKGEDGAVTGRDALGVRLALVPAAEKAKEKSPDAVLYYVEPDKM